MFTPFRITFAVLLAVFISVIAFSHFHGAIFALTSTISGNWKVISGHISPTAVNRNYIVSVVNRYKQDELAAPVLPDISGFTVDSVAAKIPPFKAGKVAISDMTGIPDLREFAKEDGRIQHQRLAQMTVDPQIIIIQEGDYDLPHLAEAVKSITHDDIIRKDGNTYLLRYPILVRANASLTISGKDVEELRLSQEESTFIANSGNLFILKTKVTGWSEKNNAPSLFKEKHVYRPFIVTWSGSHMYVAASTISSLGYLKGKSYGLSYSNCSFCLQDNPNLPRPTGVVVGSFFTDMYYGFYSYEADDVAIIGNTYANNIIYGVDPHDRSHRLIIAKNEAYGSGKKHGIIVSREVNNSWIFDNYCHDNHGSGIMLDRTSVNNIVANNVSAHNKGDGITFFESQNNISYGNKVYKNGVSGIRIRNSWGVKSINDQISDNGSVPIVVYTTILEKKEHDRDFSIDPYTRRADAIVSGAIIKRSDQKPVFKIEGIESLTLFNIQILSSGPMFADLLFSDETDIVAGIEKPKLQVMIVKATALLKLMQKIKFWEHA